MPIRLLRIPADIHQGVLASSPTNPHFRPLSNRGWPTIIGVWIGRSRQRKALAKLDDRLLADVGIARFEAAREVAKPFWR